LGRHFTVDEDVASLWHELGKQFRKVFFRSPSADDGEELALATWKLIRFSTGARQTAWSDSSPRF